MKPHWKKIAAAAILAGGALDLSQAAQAVKLNHANDPEAKTPQEAIHKVCDGCHNTEVVMDTPKDYDAWHDTIQSMIERGARGTPAEFDLIMQYIYENMTTVDVNSGIPEDLATVLGASDAQVQAIVARRQTKPFKDLAELEAAVPGLDAPALEAKKRMIFFNPPS